MKRTVFKQRTPLTVHLAACAHCLPPAEMVVLSLNQVMVGAGSADNTHSNSNFCPLFSCLVTGFWVKLGAMPSCLDDKAASIVTNAILSG